MFHIFTWTIHNKWATHYITNKYFGIEILYHGKQQEASLYLYPLLDDRTRTIRYFAFDTAEQQQSFSSSLKISGIWPKTAYEIARTDQTKLHEAIQNFDLSFFQTIKGIWPKTAKKILVELKTNFTDTDILKINADEKLIKDIVKSLTGMWYDKSQVMSLLSQYDQEISQDTLGTVVQRIVKEMQ